LGLYLAMGWAGVIAGRGLFAQMPGHVLALIVVGGLLYTAGFAFYLWARLPFHNTIWHGFVLVASACFFAAVAAFIADNADLTATGLVLGAVVGGESSIWADVALPRVGPCQVAA
jgi:hemolysin III